MPLTQETFAALVLEETDGRWEIHCGKLREKPSMSVDHNRAARKLARQLIVQLSPDSFEVFQNAGHFIIPDRDAYIPDVAVVPVHMVDELQVQHGTFEAYTDPIPLVVEIWSPSTGNYDIDRKIPGYQSRGDLEIWRVHPFDRQITLWRRQADGRYVESIVRDGTVTLHALPDITIDVTDLFVG